MPDRLAELWTRWLEGGPLSADEESELLRALAERPDLRQAALRDFELDGELGSAARAEREGPAFAREFLDRLDAARDAGRFVSRVRGRLKTRRRGPLLAGAAAAAVLAAAGLLLFGPEAGARQAVAVLVEARGPVRPASVGGRLHAGEGVETGPGGAARVRLGEGVELELEAETTLADLDDQDGPRAELRRGRVAVAVAPRPPGRALRLRTPEAEIRVLGTRFTVERSGTETRLDVTEGRVRLSRRSDGASIDVSAGYRAIVAPGSPLAAVPAGRPPNGSFELDADGDGLPDGWMGPPAIRRDAKHARGGRGSLRADGPVVSYAHSQDVRLLRPGGRYRISAWVKTRDVRPGGGVRLRVSVLSPGRATLMETPWRADAPDWRELSGEFVVPEGAGEVRIDLMTALPTPGETAWFDDVVLTEK